jgi:hypothetical protein
MQIYGELFFQLQKSFKKNVNTFLRVNFSRIEYIKTGNSICIGIHVY